MRRSAVGLIVIGLSLGAGANVATASAGGLVVEAYVIEQQCFGEDLFVDMSAATNLPGAVVQFRWDFDSDGVFDTEWNLDPFERPVYLGDGQEITATVAARNRGGGRARDSVTFTAVDCIPG